MSVVIFMLALLATAAALFQVAGKVGVFGYAFLGLGGVRLMVSSALAALLWIIWFWI